MDFSQFSGLFNFGGGPSGSAAGGNDTTGAATAQEGFNWTSAFHDLMGAASSIVPAYLQTRAIEDVSRQVATPTSLGALAAGGGITLIVLIGAVVVVILLLRK